MEKNKKVEKNGLCLHQIKSTVDPLKELSRQGENLEELISQKISNKPFAVVYLDNKVLIGNFENKEFYFYNGETLVPKYVQRLRVFNETQEFLVWRTSDGFKGRLRIDEEGVSTDVVDAQQVLFGTKANSLDSSYTKISETRGTALTLPFSNLNVDDKNNRVCIKTRNYIDFNKAHQATYVDCRFMGFTMNGKDLE